MKINAHMVNKIIGGRGDCYEGYLLMCDYSVVGMGLNTFRFLGRYSEYTTFPFVGMGLCDFPILD